MYEKLTFEYILKRALNRVEADVDKRQGSIIWDALAPACAELAQVYIEMDNILNLTFAETSYGEWLDKRCNEYGIYRESATAAIRLGVMYGRDKVLVDIPTGSRFSMETINYIAVEKIETGKYKLLCEETGIQGNQLFGNMIPIETIKGLSVAELSEVIVPGESEETDKRFYDRYVEALNTRPYGGNIADYKQKVRAINGVFDSKVFPVWNGGGTVRIVVITTEFEPPTDIFVSELQQIIDPIPFQQQGKGIAPIGHFVTVAGVKEINIDISTTLILKDISIGQIRPEVEEVVKDYFLELSKMWANEENLIVRISQIEAKIVGISGVVDICNTTINGQSQNIILATEEIPKMGGVVLHE